jgi:hypothetical protein
MEEDSARNDMRRLLKTFGIQADEVVIAHRARLAPARALHIRLVLEDLTDYGEAPPSQPLRLEVEGDIGE